MLFLRLRDASEIRSGKIFRQMTVAASGQWIGLLAEGRMFATFLAGFALSLSLILAIGAQNAFVLRQGLRKSHVFWVCFTCGLSDAILICAGVVGFGTLAQNWPWFETAMRYGGAAFLIWYGFHNARSAWIGGHALAASDQPDAPLAPTLLTVLALTWLNPHVYLDTVVLIGSISAQYEDRLAFGLGAALASFVFFFALGFGARALAPLFARSSSWQILDAVVATTMWVIAAKLLFT